MTHILTPTRQAGFSLVETLIAIAVLAVGLASMAKFQGTVLQDSSLAKARTEAAALGESRIDQLRVFADLNGYNAIVAGTDTVTAANAGSNTAYTRTWTVATNTNPPHKVLTMQVTWPDKNGDVTPDTTTTLTTIIGQLDPRVGRNPLSPPTGGVSPGVSPNGTPDASDESSDDETDRTTRNERETEREARHEHRHESRR